MKEILDNPGRYHRAVRAELIARSEEYAEAFAELWQAEEPYLRLKATQRRKSHDKVAYAAAKARYEEARTRMGRAEILTTGLRMTCELEVWKEIEAAKPKLTDPTYFVTWLRKHVGLYFIARREPARVLFAPIWLRNIRTEYERRYLLFAALHRTFMADGVEASMKLYQEEIGQKLMESVEATMEIHKIDGDSAHRNERFDGGYYEHSVLADLTPILSKSPIKRVAEIIAEIDSNPADWYE